MLFYYLKDSIGSSQGSKTVLPRNVFHHIPNTDTIYYDYYLNSKYVNFNKNIDIYLLLW